MMMLFHESPFATLQKRWRFIVVLALLTGLLSGAVSMLFPLEYRADAQVLIISKSRYGVDPYTSVKSAERVGENIVQVVKTDDFYEKVMTEPGFSLDRRRFESKTEREKRKAWQKAVETSVVYGTGVMNISAYGITKDVAIGLSGAVAQTLATRGWEYVGGDITMKVVNEPVPTRYPVRPNIPLNMAVGGLLGGTVAVFLSLRRAKRK